MPARTIGLGALLIAVGVIVTILASSGSVTSLIPAFVGVLFLVIGAMAAVREDLRKHLMHAAAAFALISIVATAGSLIGRWSEATGWAKFSQFATIVLCGLFIQQAVASFRAARLARRAAEGATT